jgi:hypothetical protein
MINAHRQRDKAGQPPLLYPFRLYQRPRGRLAPYLPLGAPKMRMMVPTLAGLLALAAVSAQCGHQFRVAATSMPAAQRSRQ